MTKIYRTTLSEVRKLMKEQESSDDVGLIPGTTVDDIVAEAEQLLESVSDHLREAIQGIREGVCHFSQKV